MDPEKEKNDEPEKPPRTVPSEDILQGETEVWIEHGGELYRLRQTRNGKLILHK